MVAVAGEAAVAVETGLGAVVAAGAAVVEEVEAVAAEGAAAAVAAVVVVDVAAAAAAAEAAAAAVAAAEHAQSAQNASLPSGGTTACICSQRPLAVTPRFFLVQGPERGEAAAFACNCCWRGTPQH